MPPLYGESSQSAKKFLSKLNLSGFKDPHDIGEIMKSVDRIDKGNTAVKASIDLALHDLLGKIKGQSVNEMLGLNRLN